MSQENTFTIHLQQIQDYEFNVKFDFGVVASLSLDEPPPLGRGHGPNASRLLAAAVANCLSASLVFCLQKFRLRSDGLQTTVTGTLVRNEYGRMRVGGFDVKINLNSSGLDQSKFKRCLAQFQDFCVVTESVRRGIPVTVDVVDANGRSLLGVAAPPAAAVS